MQDHNNEELTTRTTGRGYNRQRTDAETADTGIATDLYAPVPGDDNDTRPGMVDERPVTTTSHIAPRTTTSRTVDATTDYRQDWNTTSSSPTTTYTSDYRRQSDSGVMDKVKANPLAVVAAATAGGMLLGRMMRNRNKRDTGYMRAARTDYGYRGYQPSYSYQQPSFRPYQEPTGYQGYQGQGSPQGYQPAPGIYGAPQYRADQEFEGRHENFRGGSHWD